MAYRLLYGLLILPVAFAFTAQVFGFTVTARDDYSYITELSGPRPFTIAPDELSWQVLHWFADFFEDPSIALRFTGFLVFLATLFVLRRAAAGPDALGYFAVSILPLYLNLYFNQVRTAIAILVFLFLLTTRRLAFFAPAGAVLGHASALLLFFPPMLLLIPLALETLAVIYPNSVFLLRLIAYRDIEVLPMSWYFGWELVGLALVYLSLKWRGTALQLIAVFVACRLIGDTMSLDITRRALELTLFAYSPICLYLRTGEPVSPNLTVYFLLIGTLQFVLSLAAGVVTVQ